MEGNNTAWSEFVDLDLDSSSSNVNGSKQEKQLSASQRRYYSFSRRKVSVDHPTSSTSLQT